MKEGKTKLFKILHKKHDYSNKACLPLTAKDFDRAIKALKKRKYFLPEPSPIIMPLGIKQRLDETIIEREKNVE